MKDGTFLTLPISLIMRRTCSFAPPCSGPNRAATPADTAENGSTCDDPTARTALVEQFCSWSACRMNRISSARVKIGFASRSEEHTSELQSRLHLVCRLLLEKKK